MPLPKDWRAFIESFSSREVEKKPRHQNRAVTTSYGTVGTPPEGATRSHPTSEAYKESAIATEM